MQSSYYFKVFYISSLLILCTICCIFDEMPYLKQADLISDNNYNYDKIQKSVLSFLHVVPDYCR